MGKIAVIMATEKKIWSSMSASSVMTGGSHECALMSGIEENTSRSEMEMLGDAENRPPHRLCAGNGAVMAVAVGSAG